MRFYNYRATDSAGRPAEGTIRAASAAAAREALTQAGYRVTFVGDVPAATPAPVAPVAVAARPVAALRPVPATTSGAAIPQRSAAPAISTANPPAVTTVKTRYGRDKDLYFLFTQLGQLFRAGIAPQAAFQSLAAKSKPQYVPSLQEIERSVAEGKRISEVLERYPYLYPPDVVGVVRAGEVSGHLPEAFANISDQVAASSRIKRRLSFFLYLLVAMLACFPVIYGVVTGSLKSIELQDKAGGTLPVEQTLLAQIRGDLGKQLIPSLLAAAAFTAFLFFWHSMPMRMFRHRLILGFPVLGGRAKAESISRLTWALGLVAQGGVSPQTTFALAADCVPNLVMRERLIKSAQGMHEAERLSVALQRADVLPREYVHIVETGEMTGDVPRAMADIYRSTDADLKAREGTAVTMSSFLFYVALGALALFMCAFLYRTLYFGIFKTLTE